MQRAIPSPLFTMSKKRHIDNVQPETVAEHFRLLVEDESTIGPEFTEVSINDLPEWFDPELFKKGQQWYLSNLLGLGSAALIGLIAIIAVPETLEVLIYTKQSGHPCVAFRRYSQTLLHIYKLYQKDILDPESKWFDEVNVIRWKHATAHKRSKNAGLRGIYQRDMAITQFGFLGYAVLRHKELGLRGTKEDVSGFLHVWRVVGHLLGVSDKLNICRKNDNETVELCKLIADEIIAKHMSAKRPEYLELIRHVIDGMWYIDPSLDREAFIALSYQLTGAEYGVPLRLYSYWHLKYRQIVMYLCTVPYIGAVINGYYQCLLPVIYWMLENWPIFARIGFGKEKSRLHLYPKLK